MYTLKKYYPRIPAGGICYFQPDGGAHSHTNAPGFYPGDHYPRPCLLTCTPLPGKAEGEPTPEEFRGPFLLLRYPVRNR